MEAGSDVRCGHELHLPHGMVLVQPLGLPAMPLPLLCLCC